MIGATLLPTVKAAAIALAVGLAVGGGSGFWVGARWERGANAIAAELTRSKAEEGSARVAAQDRAALQAAATERTKAETRARDLSLRIADAAQKPPPPDCRLPVADRWLLNSAVDTANGEDSAGSVHAGVPEATKTRE